MYTKMYVSALLCQLGNCTENGMCLELSIEVNSVRNFVHLDGQDSKIWPYKKIVIQSSLFTIYTHLVIQKLSVK